MTERVRFKNPEITEHGLSSVDLEKVLSVQSAILQAAVVSEDTVGLLDQLCRLAESVTPQSVATVMLFQRELDGLYVEAGPSLSETAVLAFNGLKLGEGSCGNAVFHNEPMYVCDTSQDARWETRRDLASQLDIRACWSLPIRNESGEAIGSFAISSFTERGPEAFHQALLNTCTSIAEVILQRRQDYEARYRWQREQVKAEKLASLGVLAGGLAHDFNNLLGTILGNVDLALSLLPPDQAVRKYLETAKSATSRAGDLTKQLLTFSRGGAPVKQPSDVNALIKESAEFALHGSNIELVFETAVSTGYCIDLDSGQIGRVIQNLVLNARQVMAEGGKILIQIDEVSSESFEGGLSGNAQTFLRIAVTDTGPGIPAEALPLIFDPYFTTRHDGSGLGLALAYSIISAHKGQIVAENSAQGARFVILLPVQGAAIESVSDATSVVPFLPAGTVLLMDDQELVRNTAVAMLTHLGQNVVQASNGEEALARFSAAKQSGEIISAAILDLTIPGAMGGIEALAGLRKLDPALPVIVASGYSADQVLSRYRDYGFTAALQKPFNLDDLARALAEALSP